MRQHLILEPEARGEDDLARERRADRTDALDGGQSRKLTRQSEGHSAAFLAARRCSRMLLPPVWWLVW